MQKRNGLCYNKFRIGVLYMIDRITNENKLYIQEWTKNNPNISSPFILEGSILYKDEKKTQKIDLKDIYLPEILENEYLRKKIMFLDADTLFEIIQLFVETKEILKKEIIPSTTILSYQLKKNEKESYLVFEDSLHKKYKLETQKPEVIIDIYESLKNQHGEVTLKELGSEIKNATIQNRI